MSVCSPAPAVSGNVLSLFSDVFEYLQDDLPLLVRQVIHGSPLPLFSHKVVILLLSLPLFFIALLQVVGYFTVMLRIETGDFRQYVH